MSISVSVDEALLREAAEATHIHDPAELVRQALMEKIARENLPEDTATDVDGTSALPEPKPSFAERWKGKFQLPPPDPTDPRLNYLLERYERGAR
jgi:hypothetical protein